MLWAKWILPAKYPLKLRERVSVPCAGAKGPPSGTAKRLWGRCSVGREEQGSKMHREDFEEFRRQQAEEEFFRLAALEIENEENEEFWKAQDQPDPPPEVMERLHAHLQADMRRAGRKTRRRRALKQLAQMAACLAIVCCVGFTGVYLTVDAARTAINNFVLEMFDGNALAWTEETSGSEGVTLPDNWDGPFDVMWVPARFTEVRANDFSNSWQLYYGDAHEENLLIAAWSVNSLPNVDMEDMEKVEEKQIQGGNAIFYSRAADKTNMLLWTVNDYIVQITGSATTEEIEIIAENFMF